MKRFLKNILIVFIPTVLASAYILFIFFNYNLHRLYSDDIINKQVLLGEPYNDELFRQYKLQHNVNDYELLAIGSSRVLQFSQDMFSQKFFNFGYTVMNIRQTKMLVDDLNIRNKTLIIGVDQWAFNSNWSYVHDSVRLPSENSTLATLANNRKLFDILKGKVHPVIDKIDTDGIILIGSGANLALDGIISDGSYYYGRNYDGLLHDHDLTFKKSLFSDVESRIKTGQRSFEYGKIADTTALQELKQLIRVCQQANNKLILFFPPFAPSIYDQFKNHDYSYMQDASRRIGSMCRQMNVPFYDFTSFPSDDAAYVDGFHGGKQVYYQIATQMNLPVAKCDFINPFESVADSSYVTLRKRFFKRD